MNIRPFMPMIKWLVIFIVIGVAFVRLNAILNFSKVWKAFVDTFWRSWDDDKKKEKENKK